MFDILVDKPTMQSTTRSHGSWHRRVTPFSWEACVLTIDWLPCIWQIQTRWFRKRWLWYDSKLEWFLAGLWENKVIPGSHCAHWRAPLIAGHPGKGICTKRDIKLARFVALNTKKKMKVTMDIPKRTPLKMAIYVESVCIGEILWNRFRASPTFLLRLNRA